MQDKKNYRTVVFRLPDDATARKQFSETIKFGGSFCGATITGLSFEDEISKIEYLEDVCGDQRINEASAYALKAHEST